MRVPEGVVRVVLIDTGTPGNEDYLRRCTTADQDQAGAFRRPAAAKHWLIARGALRRALAADLEAEPHQLEFVAGVHGKPRVVGADVEFNVSHAPPFAAVAIARRPVGVDIERPRSIRRPARLAERLLDPDDLARWRAFGPAEANASLLQCWTRTEAVLKATGEGIAGGTRGAVRRLGVLGWAVRDLPPASLLSTVTGAVASHGDRWRLEWHSPGEPAD